MGAREEVLDFLARDMVDPSPEKFSIPSLVTTSNLVHTGILDGVN